MPRPVRFLPQMRKMEMKLCNFLSTWRDIRAMHFRVTSSVASLFIYVAIKLIDSNLTWKRARGYRDAAN